MAIFSDKYDNFMGKRANLAMYRLSCPYFLSWLWGKHSYDHWFPISRGILFTSSLLQHFIDSWGRISYSAESIEAVPSAARRFYSLREPVESYSSIFLRESDITYKIGLQWIVLQSELMDLGSEVENEGRKTLLESTRKHWLAAVSRWQKSPVPF